MNPWARKSIEALRRDAVSATGADLMPRAFGTFALTCVGVGSTIGAGIFVLTGTVAAQHTGPAVIVAFVLAGFACLMAGLCYAELASMIPVAGSAYSYTYATLGEGAAWLVGWCLVLEYLFSGSMVAIGWSGYVQSALRDVGITLPDALARAPLDVTASSAMVATGGWINLPAVLVTLLCMAILLAGSKTSAGVNTTIVTLKVVAIVLVVIAGAAYVDTAHWQPFLPPNTGTSGSFGWSGVLRGSAILFYAYLGFDAVSTLGQETRNPQRTIPASLLASLAVSTALYVMVGLVVTGLVDYRELNVPDPIYFALERAGPQVAWAKRLVGFVAICGLVSVLLIALMAQIRIFYAMGRDGLLPGWFARLNAKTAVPDRTTLLTSIAAALAAGLLPLSLLGQLISIGTLLAFAVVCAGVVVLRITQPNAPRPFRTPLGLWTAGAGVLSCTWLMLSLPLGTWVRLLSWLLIGGLIYLLYGSRHSALRLAASSSDTR
jgi:APA family basic amino acid/polyamine antiporter